MLQELDYEKQSKYYVTQVTYEGFEPVWHVQVYIFTPSPSEGFLRSRRSIQPSPQDETSTLEFVMPPVKLTWSLVCVITNSWMEGSMPTFLNELVELPTPMWSLYLIQGTSSSKMQVELTTALTKELDSTTEEVEFWQEKYEEAMKIDRKLKYHCPQGMETLSEDETEEFTLTSPPRKMVTRALPVYVIPNNDDDLELLLFVRSLLI
jgi:hypothetical protein